MKDRPFETPSNGDLTSGPGDPQWLERHWRQMGDLAASDFRAVAASRMAVRLLGGRRQTVLDVGCGYGLFVAAASRVGNDVVGIDTSARQIEGAKLQLAAAGLPASLVRQSTLQDLDPSLNAFDAVVMLDVLEHVAEPATLLRSAAARCRQEGRLIASVPAVPDLYDERDRLSGHYRRYDPQMLAGDLERGGFRVETIQWWNFLGWVQQMARRRLRPDRPSSYEFRYSRSPWARALNAALGSYFSLVENRIPVPVGLSLFAVARRP